MYLLYFLKELQKHLSFSLRAMHVQHGIRGEEAVEDARGESVEHLGGREIEAESEGVATTIPEYQSEGDDDDDAKVHVEPAPQVEERTEAESKDANEKEE